MPYYVKAGLRAFRQAARRHGQAHGSIEQQRANCGAVRAVCPGIVCSSMQSRAINSVETRGRIGWRQMHNLEGMRVRLKDAAVALQALTSALREEQVRARPAHLPSINEFAYDLDGMLTEMQVRLREAVAALQALADAWDEEQVRAYPRYLPSFDEFIHDLDGMLEEPDTVRRDTPVIPLRPRVPE